MGRRAGETVAGSEPDEWVSKGEAFGAAPDAVRRGTDPWGGAARTPGGTAHPADRGCTGACAVPPDHRAGSVSRGAARGSGGRRCRGVPGITTSTAMLIAEEPGVPLAQVRITLADARPELLFNQLTGGSNTTFSTYTPIPVAAALARNRLLASAATAWGIPASRLTLKGGRVTGPGNRSTDIGPLSGKAAGPRTEQVAVTLHLRLPVDAGGPHRPADRDRHRPDRRPYDPGDHRGAGRDDAAAAGVRPHLRGDPDRSADLADKASAAGRLLTLMTVTTPLTLLAVAVALVTTPLVLARRRQPHRATDHTEENTRPGAPA
ncbi:molybdopterin cofactor-binding domain-containing protein [Streptomyces sp. NPDC016675]|uniref:molybdopterin cofactor-binding domain-containing protein n=1 Tax=Streptomyces sp. NPDC016675 TaxID=3364970 RepID=UPI0036F92A3F